MIRGSETVGVISTLTVKGAPVFVNSMIISGSFDEGEGRILLTIKYNSVTTMTEHPRAWFYPNKLHANPADNDQQ
jgi:hypothetical protein